jgi:hypothetical protein
MLDQQKENVDMSVPVVLFLIFLVLKLTEVIDWSWWWVTAPLWGAVILGVLWLGAVGAAVRKHFDKHKR